ncbi:flagellin [Candidatus Eisenbacteria bacterium]|uniref:Flagellin n=1 Tax=Eiseniibacteriota bacterium TaxID=2212470 RepID=A0ABV6YKI4_UNCEI
MANMDLTRIRSNIQALSILHNLRGVNNNLAKHQLRVGTGKRINSAGDDPAGLTISTKLQSRYRVMGQLYDNIDQANNMLAVAEGALLSVNDILTTMNEKIIMSASDSIGTTERQAISQQLVQLVSEINDIADDTEFNGVQVLGSTTSFTFQTAEDGQTVWTTQSFDTTTLGMTNFTALTDTDTIDSTNYQSFYSEVEVAMETVSNALTALGSLSNRMATKSDIITVTRNATESAYNRIANADMAQEQMELTKYQLLQQTSLVMLAQANMSPQSLLTLFQ